MNQERTSAALAITSRLIQKTGGAIKHMPPPRIRRADATILLSLSVNMSDSDDNMNTRGKKKNQIGGPVNCTSGTISRTSFSTQIILTNRLPKLPATIQETMNDVICLFITSAQSVVRKKQVEMGWSSGLSINRNSCGGNLFTETAVRKIAPIALERETGARGLRSVIEEVLEGVLFDVEAGVRHMITQRTVLGGEAVRQILNQPPLRRHLERHSASRTFL
jgi:hypothetical protein